MGSDIPSESMASVFLAVRSFGPGGKNLNSTAAALCHRRVVVLTHKGERVLGSPRSVSTLSGGLALEQEAISRDSFRRVKSGGFVA